MFRNIPIHERLHAQFRVEMFNLFNRVKSCASRYLRWHWT